MQTSDKQASGEQASGEQASGEQASGEQASGKQTSDKNTSAKLQRIRDIWSGGRGVMSLHIFSNRTEEEAYTREACLIEAIGM